MGSGRIGRWINRILGRVRSLLRAQAGDLLAENMAATIIASMAVLGAASGAVMLSQISVAFDQGVEQRQASTNAVTAAVAAHRSDPLTETGKTVTQDGVPVKVWSSVVGGQTLYHGKPVKCVGPGCREFVTPLPTVGNAMAGAVHEHQVLLQDSVMEFELPAGSTKFFFAMTGIEARDKISWRGTSQSPEGVRPTQYAFTSEGCLTQGCRPVNGGSVFGVVDLGEAAAEPIDFVIHLWNPTEGDYTLSADDNVIVYTLPEGATS